MYDMKQTTKNISAWLIAIFELNTLWFINRIVSEVVDHLVN